MKAIRRFSAILIFIVVFLLLSGWMVRLWMGLAIPLPITEGMMDFALELYDYQNQEESAEALALLAFAVVLPMNAVTCWCAARLWKHFRGRRVL